MPDDEEQKMMKVKGGRYLRNLDGLESVYAMANKTIPHHMSVAVELESKIAKENWQVAFTEVQQRHPLTTARIAINDDENFFYHPDNKSFADILFIEEDTTLDDAMTEMHNHTFQDTTRPLIHLRLYGTTRQFLCLSAHHSIGDGLSLISIIRELFSFASGRGHEMTARDYVPSVPLSMTQLCKKYFPKKNSISVKAVESVDPGRRKILNYVNQSATVNTLVFSEEQGRKIKRTAKEQGATVNGVFTAAAVFAFKEMHRDAWQITSCIAVDAKALLNRAENETALTVFGIFGDHNTRQLSRWDLARNATESAKQIKTIENCLSSVEFFNSISAIPCTEQVHVQDFHSRVLTDVFVTNLGEIAEMKNYPGIKVKNIIGPAVILSGQDQFLLGVAGYRDTISVTYPSFSPQKEFLQKVKNNVITMCL